MYNLPFRVSGFVALAIAELLADGFFVWHSAPPIYDTPLTLNGRRKAALSHLSQTRNQLFRQSFPIDKYKFHRQPIHLGECRGFGVNTAAMTYQIKRKGGGAQS